MSVPLPFRVGIFSRRWYAAVALLMLPVTLGLYAYSRQIAEGLIVTGMRTIGVGGSTWGLYIAFDVYFVGVSFAGITVASLIRLFNITELKPLSRMAELLTIVSLILALPCILADLGQPLKGLLYLPRFARPISPFFGTFTLVAAGYLFASLVYFWLAGRADAAFCAERARSFRWFYRMWAWGYRGTPEEKGRHQTASFWLAVTILPLLVTAHSTLGFIFGIQGGRPGWYSALQAPGFVMMAGVSGLGVLIVIAAAIRGFCQLQEIIRDGAFRLLSNFLMVLTLIYLYFMVVEELTANYASSEIERDVAHQVVMGHYSWIFLTVAVSLIVAFALLFLQFALGRYRIIWAVISGILVNVAAVLKRFLIVVPSQTHGLLLPYQAGSYSPTWVEFSIIVALFAFGSFLFLLFLKIFPIVPVKGEGEITRESSPESSREKFLRRAFFIGTLLTGISLAVIGFFVSARIGTRPHLDPVIPYSPVIFIIGVMMSFYSAAVYEVFRIPRAWLKEKP